MTDSVKQIPLPYQPPYKTPCGCTVKYGQWIVVKCEHNRVWAVDGEYKLAELLYQPSQWLPDAQDQKADRQETRAELRGQSNV